jgi:putative phage-type endonuclease
MELFELPLEQCTHLTHLCKHICHEHQYSYKNFKRQVYKLFETDLGKVWSRRRKIFRVLRDYGKSDQRTEGWLQKRSEMITASEVSKAFRSATPSARYELLCSKVKPRDTSGTGPIAACLWGTQFEPIAKNIYSDIQGGADILDVSCVQHRIHTFLGASPDGIVLTKDPTDIRWGRLVEFKCPISRQFSQESAVPDYYYHQMQLQMECTGIDECDYVEIQFKTCTQTQYKNYTKTPYKGIFVVYDNGQIAYKDDKEDFKQWKQSLEGDEYRIVYWTLENIRIKNIKRDFDWLEKHIDELREFWKIVHECRADPSKMEHYVPQTGRRDVPSESLLVDVLSQEPEANLSSGRTMILRLDE